MRHIDQLENTGYLECLFHDRADGDLELEACFEVAAEAMCLGDAEEDRRVDELGVSEVEDDELVPCHEAQQQLIEFRRGRDVVFADTLDNGCTWEGAKHPDVAQDSDHLNHLLRRNQRGSDYDA